MTTSISSWVAHATRDPSDLMLSGMIDWCESKPAEGQAGSLCPWLMSDLHRILTMHVDRAAHKRRHSPFFVCGHACNELDHGASPMSALVRDDVYGLTPLAVEHRVGQSPLGAAIAEVKDRDSQLAVAIMSEHDFENADFFDVHRSLSISPTRDGVALAIIHAETLHKENADDEAEREDLLRASGYSMYMIDLRVGEDARHMHRRIASLMEDVFDEITQIKADAAARVLMSDPLWPAIVIRTGPEWRAAHGGALVGSTSAS